MWRLTANRLIRFLRGFFLWGGLLLVVLTLPVLGVLGSEGGSRWLIERGLGMQKALSLQVTGGTLLAGMEFSDVRLHTRKSDLYIRRLLARWSLVQLLRGEVDLLDVQADGVILELTAPPSRDVIRLPKLVIPVSLDIHSLSLTNTVVRKRGKSWSVALIEAKGYWQGAAVSVEHLLARDPRYGGLALAGRVALQDNYPLQASGQVSPRWLMEKGWQPLRVRLHGDIARLGIQALARGGHHVDLAGEVLPLLPDLPYNASVKWSDLQLPGLERHVITSPAGRLKVVGDKNGLKSQGDAELLTRHTPPGQYRWDLSTDWSSSHFESLKINGLGGEVDAKGDLSWRSGLAWDVRARMARIDLAKHWPVSRTVLPVLSGQFRSHGSNHRNGSRLEAFLALSGGETWQLSDQSSGLLWDLEARHQANLEWASVSRPLDALRGVQSDSGSLAIEGGRQDYRLVFNGGMTSGLFPAGEWSGVIRGGGRHVEVDHLSYAGDAGGFQAGGALDFGPGVEWQGAVVLDNFDTTWLSDNWSGQYNGAVSGRGRWTKGQTDAVLGDVNVTGTLRGHPLRLDGSLTFVLPKGHMPSVTSTGFSAAWGRNTVEIKGGLSNRVWDGRADLSFDEPSMLVPGLAGRFDGHVVLSGAEKAPTIQADLKAGQVAFAGYSLRQGQVRATVPDFGSSPGAASVAVSGITMPSGAAVGDLDLAVKGIVSEHVVDWSLSGGPVTADGHLQGNYDVASRAWSGALRTSEVAFGGMQWQLSGPEVPFAWSQQEQSFVMDGHCWQSVPATFCLSESLRVGKEGHVVASLSGLEAERLAAFLPEGLLWKGRIEGDVSASWQKGEAPVAKAELGIDGGVLQLARDDAEPIQMRYDQFRINLDADASSVRSTMVLASDDLGNGQLGVVLNPWVTGKPLSGDLALRGLRLELLRPFLPALSVLTGTVSAEGRLDGPLARPRFWGAVQVADGKLTLRNAPVVVDDMSAWIDVQGDKADFSGQLRSGEGGATISGNAEWYDQPKVMLALRGDRFAVRQEPQLQAELSPDLQLQLVPGELDLTGVIRVPYARVNLKELPQRSVSLSPDVRVVASSEDKLQAVTVTRGRSMRINADVELVLGDDVFFNGFGVIGGLNGGIRLRQSSQRGMEASGELELDKESRYEAYGQKLKVRHGRLIFAGSLGKPAIDAEAIREVDDKIVGIRVTGRANAPEATLFSEPSMAQADMLSYLVLGRPLAARATDGSSSNDAMLAAAAIKLGARGGEGLGLTSGIGSILGVKDLSLDAEGSGDDTQVKVSGYLNPDLFLSYGVGVFTPVNTVTMRYQVRPRLYLEAVSSLENAIDLFYNFRF